MVEHTPWLGGNYSSGIRGQRIAVVGYSCYIDDRPDSQAVTTDIIEKMMDNDRGWTFYNKIKSYFDFTDAGDFWNRVLFFNFIPNAIGGVDRRYDAGTAAQIEEGQKRTGRIMRHHLPHKILVFTKRGWTNFPPTEEEACGGECPSLSEGFPHYTRGTYNLSEHKVLAFGLRHPQGARSEEMRSVVREIIAI